MFFYRTSSDPPQVCKVQGRNPHFQGDYGQRPYRPGLLTRQR